MIVAIMDTQTQVEFITLPFEYSQQRVKGIGLVAPFDFALDDECWRWMPAGIPLYISRTARLEDTAVTATLAHNVSDAATVVPAVRSLISAEPTAVGYACTSGSFVGGTKGEAELRTIMENAGGENAVTTSGALLESLKALNITKLSIATPYNQELTQLLAKFLQDNGVQVMKAGYLNSEHEIMHITYDSVKAMVREIDHPQSQAIFFSCTNLRTFDIIEDLETSLNKPILSANQVTIWATLKHAGLPMPEVNQRLFMV
jgi:maleate isomerase